MIINRREAVGNVNGLAKTCSEPSVFRSAKEPKEVRESVFMRYGEGIAAAVCGVLTLVAWLGESRLGWVSTLLYLLAYAVGGYAKGKEGILTLSQERKLDVNLLMIIAALGAAAIGYWLEGAVLIFIFALSGAMERVAEGKSRKDLSSLMEMKPETALRVDGQRQQVVPIEELRIGDRVLIRPGSRIPVDGRVIEGRSAVNQASITGESLPVDKGEGDEVFAGTMNGRGSLLVEVTRLADESLFSKIIRLVEKAQNEVPRSQRVIERLERWYVTSVLVVTGILMTVPPLLFSWNWSDAFYRAMVFLVVASPCAVMASIMPAVLSAMSNGARKGVLFKGSMVLEGLSGVKVVAFDKTGTLTEGRLQVTDVIPVAGEYGEEEILRIAATIESVSEHPIAQAIVAQARQRGMELKRPSRFESMPGKGVVAEWNGGTWKVGKPAFVEGGELAGENGRIIDRLDREGKTVVGIASEEGVVGWIALQDRIRPEAKAAVSRLKRMGIRVVMLTGDRRSTGEAIGNRIGVDEVHAELLPEDKVRLIQELEKKYGRVAMAGDGVNDAPALATASVGIAMGRAGTDVALDVADVVLMNDDLDRVATTLSLGRRTRNIIVQNLVFASLVIFSLILANFGGHISLPFGVVGHEGSTILVILNGLRLLR